MHSLLLALSNYSRLAHTLRLGCQEPFALGLSRRRRAVQLSVCATVLPISERLVLVKYRERRYIYCPVAMRIPWRERRCRATQGAMWSRGHICTRCVISWAPCRLIDRICHTDHHERQPIAPAHYRHIHFQTSAFCVETFIHHIRPDSPGIHVDTADWGGGTIGPYFLIHVGYQQSSEIFARCVSPRGVLHLRVGRDI